MSNATVESFGNVLRRSRLYSEWQLKEPRREAQWIRESGAVAAISSNEVW